MSEGDHGLHHAVAPGVTRDETRNTFDGMSEGDHGLHHAVAGLVERSNPRGQIIMAQPSPLSVLSGALKIADKVTVALQNA